MSISGGIGKIDIEDWKSHTRLKHCNADNPIVKWFWEIVDSYSEEMRARLLQFVTGSSRVRKRLVMGWDASKRFKKKSGKHSATELDSFRLKSL